MKSTKLLIALLLLTPLVSVAEPSPSPASAEKLQVALADAVNKSVQVAGDAKDFLVAQLPDVVRQLLMWKAAESIWKMLLPGLALLVIAKAAKRLRQYAETHKWKYADQDNDSTAFGQILAWVMAHVAIMFAAIFFLCSLNLTWLQIWIAPKVYLVEYMRSMVSH